jgi:lambda family phage minor tail protein L
MTLFNELQTQSAGSWVELFELDATLVGGAIIRFHAGTNELNLAVVWQSQAYNPLPVKADGFDISSQALPRPRIKVSNINSYISTILVGNNLLGAKVTRKRTLVKFLDAVNFENSINPTADPNAHLPDDVYYINQKLNENAEYVEFELGSPLDLEGLTLPKRPIVANVCIWAYRGDGCGYAGGPVATFTDTPTSNPALDACSKRLSGCALRFGENNDLPIGAFPAAGLLR